MKRLARILAWLVLALAAFAVAAVIELALRKPEPAVSVERVRVLT